MTNRVNDGFDWLPTSDPGFDQMRNMMGAAGYYAFGSMMAGNGGGVGSRDALGSVYPVNPGRFAFGRALRFIKGGNAGVAGYLKPIGDQLEEGVKGFAFYYDNQNDAGCASFYCIWDAAAGVAQFSVCFTANGIIRVYEGLPDTGTQILATEAGVFLEDTWQFCEVKHGIGTTDGFVQVRINTAIKIDLVDCNTNPALTGVFDAYGYGVRNNAFAASAMINIDDTYFNDTLDGLHDDYFGNVRTKSQLAIANGSHIGLTIGGTSPAATNWQSVLNFAEDNTKFVYGTSVGAYDLYQMDPNLNSPLVHVVQARMVALQDDSTQRVLSAKIKLSGVVYDNPGGYYLDQSYSHAIVRWELNPATGVEFTGAEVNGAQLGPWLKA